MPLAFAFTAIFGVWMGSRLHSASQMSSDMTGVNQRQGSGEIDMMLNFIENVYVDTIDKKKLSEEAIVKILSGLDPHSSYIPADEVQMVNDDLKGSFSGIGVEFNLQNDTIMVTNVIKGGPSEKVGVQPGDRIVEVNDSAFVGKGMTTDKVVKKLRGKKGTKVKIGVKRYGLDELVHFDIVRDDIPTNTVDASYMIDKGIGYVKVDRFGSNTYSEFLYALESLKKDGAHCYIVDLRENPGGLLETAVAMINEFLERNSLIVYTEGKSFPREERRADGSGDFQNDSLVVLIDELSASASEIFAGAMQDNDRAMVIGRRSFGKGLVQNQFSLSNGAAVRLTIARYYIPSGRCIQKPYEDKEKYQEEVYNRYKDGEMDTDSIGIKGDSVKYYTTKGRVVYGGGGVTPDFIVPRDTVGVTNYYMKLINTRTMYDCAFQFVDKHRKSISSMNLEELCSYLDKQPLCDIVIDYATKKGIKKDEQIREVTRRHISDRMKEYIVRSAMNIESYYKVVNQSDKMIDYTLKKLKK